MIFSAGIARFSIVLQVLFALGCAHHRPAAKTIAAQITGTVSYLQRIALPQDAYVEVTFADVSLQDAPAIQLGNQVIQAAGKQVPIAFTIGYDSRQIVSSHTYAVQARIKVGERVLFSSDTANLVLTQGRPSSIEIIVKALPVPK